MITLKVPKMSCEGCVATIEKAIKSIDAQGQVKADLATKTISVETSADAASISQAVRVAGYENTYV